MNLEKSFGACATAEREGHWFRAADVFKNVPGFIDPSDPAEIKLAGVGASNPAFTRQFRKELNRTSAFRKMQQKKRGIDDLDALDGIEELGSAGHRAYAESVVLDWRGFTDATGAEIPYSPDYMVSVFGRFPRIFAAIENFVSDIDNFRIESLEEDIKNS